MGDLGGVEYCGDAQRSAEHRLQRPPQSLRALLRAASENGFFACGVQDPWPGDPRVNILNDKGKAKAYQVRQVLKAIDKKEGK